LDDQQTTASLIYAWDLDGDGIFGEMEPTQDEVTKT
jgi:hypothetical protein